MNHFRVFISTASFAQTDKEPIRLLEKAGCDIQINPHGRKLTAEEVAGYAASCEAIIAGTENLRILIERSSKLKIISRVGAGLDGVPLNLCRERNIRVSYTPRAVTTSVAELTLALMLALIRQVVFLDRGIRSGNWQRRMGMCLGESIIGLIGFGGIGSKVARLLIPFQPEAILVHDSCDQTDKISEFSNTGLKIKQVPLNDLISNADIISIHVPHSPETHHMISDEQFKLIKPGSFIINTSRGGIVNEQDLYIALSDGIISGAAIDVFESEPYTGPLTKLDNVIMTPHIGAFTTGCRALMEREAVDDVLRFFSGKELQNEVPDFEYDAQN